MNYTKSSFSVAGPGTKEYADRWERTFHPERCPECRHPWAEHTAEDGCQAAIIVDAPEQCACGLAPAPAVG